MKEKGFPDITKSTDFREGKRRIQLFTFFKAEK